MKKLIVIAVAFMLSSCYEDGVYAPDDESPAVPRGVYSVSGDGEVFLSWYANAERDLAGYRVYRGLSERGEYRRLATINSTQFSDRDVTNGRTYFYAVTAYDYDGNESELSYDVVFDTPRPEGYSVRLLNFNVAPSVAGFDFLSSRIQHLQNAATDIYFEYHAQSGGRFINVGNLDTDIQDLGFTGALDDIGYAPEDGWSPLGYAECITGHTYVIWTDDNHFAKMRVVEVTNDFVEFDWAYQTAQGNPELRVHVRTPEKAALVHRHDEVAQ